MRLLIVNFEMDENSGVRAWQARVARELAGACEYVVVLTRQVGQFVRPENMHIEVLPRRPLGIPGRLGGKWMVNLQLFRLCRQYRIDACFVHMASEWVYILYPTFRLLGIPVLMWYAHGTVTGRLRLAHQCATRVVTSTPEGFRIPSRKVRLIGQGIDTDVFRPQVSAAPRRDLVTISRVSRRKRLELLLSVMKWLRKDPEGVQLRLRVVGPALNYDDLAYDRELRARVWEESLQDNVEFVGFVPHEHTPNFYGSAFLHINVSETGSMDKTVLEALSCGCPVLTSNPAFRQLLGGSPEFIIGEESPEAIARQVLDLYHHSDEYPAASLRALVVGKHDIYSYVRQVTDQLTEMVSSKPRSDSAAHSCSGS